MHKCDGCKYKGEHQEQGFKAIGVCHMEHNLLKAVLAFNATKCPFAKTEGIRMKTHEEIKKGLECCVVKARGNTVKDCDVNCPFFHEDVFCKNVLHHDTLAYIQQLESRLAEVERERDALAYEARGCSSCVHRKCDIDEPPCNVCGQDGSEYEWRGVCPENTKEDSK